MISDWSNNSTYWDWWSFKVSAGPTPESFWEDSSFDIYVGVLSQELGIHNYTNGVG